MPDNVRIEEIGNNYSVNLECIKTLTTGNRIQNIN